MTIDEAIKQALTKHLYSEEAFAAMQKSPSRLSRPELLKDAAIECFLHEQDSEVEATIRAALIFLRQMGMMPKE